MENLIVLRFILNKIPIRRVFVCEREKEAKALASALRKQGVRVEVIKTGEEDGQV